MGSTLDTKTYLIQGDDNRKTVVLQGEGDMLLSDGESDPSHINGHAGLGTLAQRTAESTAEINQIIDTVQTGALNAVRAIESGQGRSEEGVTQVTEAGAMLQRITGAVEAIRDMNRQIATAAEEQTSVAEDISRNLTELTAIASANQDNVERTQKASRNLHDMSGQLGEVTRRLGS